MKPRLRNGQPVGQYIPRSPANINGAVYFCWCDLCAIGGAPFTKLDGSVVVGRQFYNRYDIQEHTRELKQAVESDPSAVYPLPNILSPNIGAALPALPPAAISAPVSAPLPPGNSNKDRDSPQQPQSQPTHSLEYEWQSLRIMEAHLAELKTNPLRYWNPADTQFLGDIDQSLPETIDFRTLVSDHPSNSLIIGHAEWLQRAGASLGQLSSCKSLSIQFRLKHELITRQLEQQVKATEAALREEWEKQRELRRNNQERVSATGADVLFPL